LNNHITLRHPPTPVHTPGEVFENPSDNEYLDPLSHIKDDIDDYLNNFELHSTFRQEEYSDNPLPAEEQHQESNNSSSTESEPGSLTAQENELEQDNNNQILPEVITNNPPPNDLMGDQPPQLNGAQLADLLRGLTNAIDGLPQALQDAQPEPQPRETNLVKVDPFFSGNQDPISWLEDFERATSANGMNDARRLAIVPAHLKGAASVWLTERQAQNVTNPVRWQHADGATQAQINITFR